MSPEFLEALNIVREQEKQISKLIFEPRLYYNEHGDVYMYCETNHPPDTNYIILDDPELYHRTAVHLMKVIDGKLVIINPVLPTRSKIYKSTTGQPVVKGIAGLVLEPGEVYSEIEYYDKKSY